MSQGPFLPSQFVPTKFSLAARLLGIGKSTLYRNLCKLGHAAA
jgi:transcriptional regulator of acetoin/glycerol metabolism